MIKKAIAASCCAVGVLAATPMASAAPSGRLVIVTLAGFSWETLGRSQIPELRRLIGEGAVAAVSVRAATRGSTPLRGYLTLGAGNRALAEAESRPRRDERSGQIALRASTSFENGTAAEAMARRVLRPRAGEIVVPDAPALDAVQRQFAYGTRIGDLGETLVRNGERRGLVAAADLETSPRLRNMRRGVALSIADRSGTVDTGAVDGLLRDSPDAAYGVTTDQESFSDAVERAVSSADVVLIEPGETLRADEFALAAAPREARAQYRRALERTDSLIAHVTRHLTPADTLYVIGVSSPLAEPHDHLTLAVAHGAGIRQGWLTSATTHRPGMVTLTDFAPTVLSRFGIAIPKSMSGTPIRSIPSDAADRIDALASLDNQSRFGDRFQGIATNLVVGLMAAVAIALAGSVWLRGRWAVAAVWLSLAALAVPTAAYVVRVIPLHRAGVVVATVVFGAITALIATGARLLPLDVWKSGLVLVALAWAWTTGDLLAGARLQVNNVFGYSPISAGRFYGNSNIAFAIFAATTLIGVFGLLELVRKRRIPLWAVVFLVAAVVIQGLPQFGADFGGVAASVPAMLVAYAVPRGRRVKIWRLVAWAGTGAVAALVVALADAARPPETRTHLGRFAAGLISGGTTDVSDVITRKVQSNFALLGSAWTWTVPLAVVIAVLLVRSNAHVFGDLITERTMLTAGITGTLVAGIVGFAVNDTGIWVLGMILAIAAPMAVLAAPSAATQPSRGRIGSTDGLVDVQGPEETAGSRRQGRPQE